MNCPSDDKLAAITTLPKAERAAIADHAATCETCREIVSDLLGVETRGSFAEAETLAEPTLDAGTPPSIDRYRIDRRLGAGAMGVVYAGFDPELARPVAIKVLKSGGSPERMRREAQALAQLSHPNVVAVHDVGEQNGSTFVAMAFVDGENLRTWLERSRTTEQIVDAIAQAARGLEVAHAAGIVHRDIKPDNIFVAKTGKVLVGDFGLARTSGEPTEASGGSLLSSSDLTRTGALVGTPAYMAPEQIDGEATAASDQFALCVTAWEALYGQRPFTGKTMGELERAVNAGPPAPPRTRSVPSHVRAAIARGLAADPKQRHPSMHAFVTALGRRRRWPYVAAGVAALAAAGIAFALRDDPEKACDALAAPSGWTLPAMRPKVVGVVDGILRRYATDWRDLAKSSCVAAARRELSEPAHAATRRCLEDRRATLFWITKQPTDILRLAESLEPVETCRGRTAETTPSAELAALQRDLSNAAAFTHHVPENATGLDALVGRATQLGDAAAIAEASYLLGLSQHAHNLDPTAALQTAISAAERAHDDRIRTRASAYLAIVTARRGRLSEALVLRDAAVSAAASATDAVTTIAVELANIEFAFMRHDGDAELVAYRRIEAIELARFGELSGSLVAARFKLAAALSRQNRPDAKRVLDLAIEGLKQLIDISPEEALAQMIVATPNPVARLPLQEQLVELVRTDPPQFRKELEKLGYDYELVGSYDRALETMRDVLALDPGNDGVLEIAIHEAFEIADHADDPAVRARHLDEALGFLDKLSATAKTQASIEALRGRILLLAGRPVEAIVELSNALAAAERTEPQEPYHIGVRSFALAQALWEAGGARERERAVALAEQAAKRLPEARSDVAAFQAGALLGRLDEQLARIEAWRRTHH